MADVAIRKPAPKPMVEKLIEIALDWFTNKNGTWCAETDLGWCNADGKLTETQLDEALANGDVTYVVDENGATNFFVGYNMTRRRHTSTISKFVAKPSERVERRVAKISAIFEEYAVE